MNQLAPPVMPVTLELSQCFTISNLGLTTTDFTETPLCELFAQQNGVCIREVQLGFAPGTGFQPDRKALIYRCRFAVICANNNLPNHEHTLGQSQSS